MTPAMTPAMAPSPAPVGKRTVKSSDLRNKRKNAQNGVTPQVNNTVVPQVQLAPPVASQPSLTSASPYAAQFQPQQPSVYGTKRTASYSVKMALDSGGFMADSY